MVFMVPVFFTIGLVAQIPLMPLGLSIAFSLSYASLLTHYDSAPGPVLFGAGYVDQKTWWTIGTGFMFIHLFVQSLLFRIWKIIGFWQ